MFTPNSAAAEIPGAHVTSHHHYKPSAASEVRRMADVLIGNQKDGRATSWGDLVNAKFTPAQIGAFFPEAMELANRSTFRRIEDELAEPPIASPDPADRSTAERMADAIVKGIGRSRSAIASLQAAGWTGTEIALNIDEANRIVDQRLRRVAPPNASLVNLAHNLSRMVMQVQSEVAA